MKLYILLYSTVTFHAVVFTWLLLPLRCLSSLLVCPMLTFVFVLNQILLPLTSADMGDFCLSHNRLYPFNICKSILLAWSVKKSARSPSHWVTEKWSFVPSPSCGELRSWIMSCSYPATLRWCGWILFFFPRRKQIDCGKLWQGRATEHSKVSWQHGNSRAPPLFSAPGCYLVSVSLVAWINVSRHGRLCQHPSASQLPPPTKLCVLLTRICHVTYWWHHLALQILVFHERHEMTLMSPHLIFSTTGVHRSFVPAQVCFSCVESYVMVWQKKKKLSAMHQPFRSWMQCQAS